MTMARTPTSSSASTVPSSGVARASSASTTVDIIEGFSSNFVTEEVILDESALNMNSTDEDDFDPFNIGVAASTKKKDDNTNKKKQIFTTREKKKMTTSTRTLIASNKGQSVNKKTDSSSGGTDTTSVADNNWMTQLSGSDKKSISVSLSALPPRLVVKFKIHEEVSSLAHLSDDNEGISNVTIEGTVLAQVVSSDALKNIPFYLIPSTDNQKVVNFTPNDTYTKKYISEAKSEKLERNIVRIPKDILGFVTVGKYRISQSMEHMPLLLEQKVVRSKSKIQIAIQVRSKLSNPDDLFKFSLVVFIPERVNGDSVSILSGDGEFDQWKRCITWEIEHLPKGQSFMVSAKCLLLDGTSEGTSVDESLKFPVMLRCISNDQISSIRFKAIEANGHPATVSSSNVEKTYRIVHRLN